jgi:hypothetical protein
MATLLEQLIERQKREIAELEARVTVLDGRANQAGAAYREARRRYNEAAANPSTTPEQLRVLAATRDRLDQERQDAYAEQEAAVDRLERLRDALRNNELQLQNDTGVATQPIAPPSGSVPASQSPLVGDDGINDTPTTAPVTATSTVVVSTVTETPPPVIGDPDVRDTTTVLPPDTQVTDQPAAIATTTSETVTGPARTSATPPGGDYAEAFDAETGTYGVYDVNTNEFVATGLTKQEATAQAEAASQGDPVAREPELTGSIDTPATSGTEVVDSYESRYDTESGTYGVYDSKTGQFVETGLTREDAEQQAALDNDAALGFENDPFAADEEDLELVYEPDAVDEDDPAAVAQVDPDLESDGGDVFDEDDPDGSAVIQALKDNAQQQASINEDIGQQQNTDWRVRLSLAQGADYLYRDPDINSSGILWPLRKTNGVIFPYTPTITTEYGANYSNYDLTHSNFRGYFYQSSYVDAVTITAKFTAQDTNEANYLLAVIHFFRSVTKMFYGQDTNRGVPPPLVFLHGFGEFQFNNAPCVVKSFAYNLPDDVDYIRARTVNQANAVNLVSRRDQSYLPVNSAEFINARLTGSGLPVGGEVYRPAPPNLGTSTPTYVPTKIDFTITLLPVQSRAQVSQQFSLKEYANGDLIRKGFW